MLTSLGQVMPAAASKFGDKTALITSDRSLSFQELSQLSDSFAANLVKMGVTLAYPR